MTDTPNTKPSEAIQRYETDVRGEDRDPYPLDTDDEGRFVLHCDHLAALARAREDARREALEEAAKVADRKGMGWSFTIDGEKIADECYAIKRAIDALIHPTPQGETKEND